MNNPTMLHEEKNVPEEMAGLRLDQALAKLFPSFSRSRLQQWLKQGGITVDGKILRSKEKLKGGEAIQLNVSLVNETEWLAQKVDLDIVYEDESLLVINKPVGMVVHPAAGNRENTLANALLEYFPRLSKIPRAGIVHRLDKETSGLLVVAKTLESQCALVNQLQNREVHREYCAIVNGVLISGGTIEAPIGRDPNHRQRMAVVNGGKSAVTHYRVIERFRAHTFIKVMLETGRTHQIRVHLSHRGFPLLGDKTYGARAIIPKGASQELIDAIRNYKHQALHAKNLKLQHPETKKMIEFEAPIPQKLLLLIELLRGNCHE